MFTEQLGSFYLGGGREGGSYSASKPILYDARDLTTHAVCVGMTGSGKTGLCVGLLEEAALDGVPALLIDPKGDITNLLLQFPELRPEDFQPWINTDDARRKGQSVEEYAANVAELWRNGLAEWGIEGTRIQALRDSADFTIFTPGSDSGVPVNIMGSLAAPEGDFDADAEMLRERITGTVAALLGLVGVKADPVRSREGILLATIFEHFWRRAEDLDLAKLILAIQTPPVDKLGVFDIETFYPGDARLALAMAFNSLVASPSFSEWLIGEPLDIASLLYQEDGRPRHSVFYLAHLSDSERMFFTTLLLENVITWMRRQSGTTSLRALLYFDEVFGFFPPTAEPPSKRPLLTIMKQARAFGLGTILVTQNPVDIDYKGLANAGTWFIGKMQTERDRARVLAGLEGAIAEAGGHTDGADFDALISGLNSREFLLHNVHADAPQLFHTRWAMSYLRGPMTRPQVRSLMEQAGKRNTETEVPETMNAVASGQPHEGTAAGAIAASSAGEQQSAPEGFSTTQPAIGDELAQYFLPVSVSEPSAAVQAKRRAPLAGEPTNVSLVYSPGVVAKATVSFLDRKHEINAERRYRLWSDFTESDEGVQWEDAIALDPDGKDLVSTPENLNPALGPYYAPLPEWFDSVRESKSVMNALSDWLYYGSRYTLAQHEALGLVQQPGESERDFLIRVRQAAREARDAEVDRMEDKFDDKIGDVQDGIAREEKKIEDLESSLSSRRQQELIGIGENALDFFLNRRSSRAFSGVGSRRRMTMKAHQALESARSKAEELETVIVDLRADLEAETGEITVKWAASVDEVGTLELKPRRVDVDVQEVALGWAPYWYYEYAGDTPSVRVAAYQLLATT